MSYTLHRGLHVSFVQQEHRTADLYCYCHDSMYLRNLANFSQVSLTPIAYIQGGVNTASSWETIALHRKHLGEFYRRASDLPSLSHSAVVSVAAGETAFNADIPPG